MKNLFKMKTVLKKTFKVLMIYSMVFSLTQNSFVSEAQALEKNNGGYQATDILNLANNALNMYGNFLGMKQQTMQQQIMAQTNQKLMSQLSPACRKADGTACYANPSKFFPECNLPASISNMPVNVCTGTTVQPAQLSSMITYEAVAQGWMNYYDQMSNEASNTPYAVGLACLNGKQKAMDSQITEMINNLQRLQDRMNQDKQIFRDNNKNLLESMNTANDELFGEGNVGKKNLKIKTQDFGKFFSQSCQSVIGKENIKNGAASGFNGILQGLSSTNKAAADFNVNKNIIENDIRSETNKIAAAIKTNGVENFLSAGYIPQNEENAKTFKAIRSQIEKQNAETLTSRKRIDKVLEEVGYTAPKLDANFSVDSEEFIAGANDFFKKKYVNDCVTGAEAGIAIPIGDILGSLEQKSTNNGGTARNDYRAALKTILESDAMMEDKMVSIKALEGQYPDITITYNDSSQSRITDSPYNLFMKTIEKCQQRFTKDDKFTSKGSVGVSYQKKVERAKAALQELKNLNDNYSSSITQSILSQVLSCGGSAPKAGKCSEETLNTSNENFCISHASSCANEIQGCYAEANTQVQARKTKMENLAKLFNANVESMIKRSNALYEQQKMAVTEMTKLIQARFPGTNFEIPKDMFVSMPELSKDKYGVQMAGDGDLKAILDGENSMPAKIDKLKQVFKLQKDTVNKSIEEYIALQKEAMEKQRGRWNDLYGQCKGSIDSSTKEMAKMNNEGQKRQNEEDIQVAKFCKKYNSISENPIGACGKAKDLAEIADKVGRRLSNKAIALSERYDSACDSYNNQNDDLTDPCFTQSPNEQSPADKVICARKKALLAKRSSILDAPIPSLKSKEKKLNYASLCGSGSKSDREFLDTTISKLSVSDQEVLKDSFTLPDVLKKANSIEDGNFFTDLASLISEGEGSICEKLKTAASADKDLDVESIEKKYASAKAEQNAIKKDAEDKIKDKDTSAKEKEELYKTKADASEKLKLLAQENDKKIELASKNLKFKNLLINLVRVTASPDPTAIDTRLAEIQKIGQQMEGPCDMQNNSSFGKPTGFFDIQQFDAAYFKRTNGR